MPYFGGKITLAPQIVDTFPPHRHYVEPFCGSLAVLLAKPPSVYETVNDLDGDLMTFWRVLRDQPEELARRCALTPHARGEQAAAYDMPAGLDDIERARRVWVQLTQGRSGIRRRTGWRHYVSGTTSTFSLPDYLVGYLERMWPAAERLHAVSLEQLPALELIAKYGAHADVLLYVDPPYLNMTRSDGSYLHEMGTADEHRALAEALRAARAAVVLSGYASDLYDLELYPDWHRTTFAASTGQGPEWANRTEVLWSNRQLGQQPMLWEAS